MSLRSGTHLKALALNWARTGPGPPGECANFLHCTEGKPSCLESQPCQRMLQHTTADRLASPAAVSLCHVDKGLLTGGRQQLAAAGHRAALWHCALPIAAAAPAGGTCRRSLRNGLGGADALVQRGRAGHGGVLQHARARRQRSGQASCWARVSGALLPRPQLTVAWARQAGQATGSARRHRPPRPLAGRHLVGPRLQVACGGRDLALRSARPADTASAPAAWLVRRAFFFTTLPASLPALLFLLLLDTTTAPSAAATSTVAPQLARPLYL